MSSASDKGIQEIMDKKSKRRRRPQATENGSKRRPIRVVSSLGEGKLLDRFQNAVVEKESKKKSRERSEKDHKSAKEKRDREMAKFQAELDALLEDNPEQTATTKKETTFVPKLSGTVKGKFEALERKKKEDEENRISNERERRTTRDLVEKKRIQIELAKKKQKGLITEDDDPLPRVTKTVKSPGKLKNNFEESDKRRKEHERKKIEMEKRCKLTSELRAMKEQQATLVDEESDGEMAKVSVQPKKPGKLKSNFTNVLRQQEAQQRHQVEEEKWKKLEEEKQQFRLAKLAASCGDSQETVTSESSIASSNASSTDKIKTKPNRLSSSFTKFDVIEKRRMEEERAKLQERRKALLEEERKLFQESRKQQENRSDSEDEKSDSKKNIKNKKPGRLDSSFTKFDLVSQQKFEEQRRTIQEERAKLLEEEKMHFKALKQDKDGESSSEDEESTESHSGSEDDSYRERSKNTKKVERTPSKLDRSRLKFDVLERERMDKERLQIQKERNKLLEEEKKLFEAAKKQEKEQESDSEQEDTKAAEQQENKESSNNVTNVKKTRKPRRLDKSFTQFDILEKRRKQEEEEELFREKAKKLEEEKRLFREAREKMKENESETEKDDRAAEAPHRPNRLSSQRTNFDMLEKARKEKERLETHENSIKKLEEEIQLFEEQRKAHQASDDDMTCAARDRMLTEGPKPKRLASSFTKFDVMERKRREEERQRLQREKAQQLAEERKLFEKSKREMEEASSENDSEAPPKDQSTPLEHRSINKMNIRGKIEAVMRAQEEAERKRIEETKFTRMTVEQQEIFLAKQRQIEFLKKQLANAEAEQYSDDDSIAEESDEENENYYYRYSDEESENSKSEEDTENDGTAEFQLNHTESDADVESKSTNSGSTNSNSSGSYSGAPYFVQTLKNISVNEGDPVRFDANINANPHPKVTWFFKNRAIRNSPDYQYMSKGTQYSLYMNESFLDDVGEYMCKAINDKGSATSKACLYVKECD